MILLYLLMTIASFMMWIGSLLLFLALRHWRGLPVVRALGSFTIVVSLAGFALLLLLIVSAVIRTQLPVLRYGICVTCALVGVVAGYAAWYLETGGEGKGRGVKAWLAKAWTQIKNMLRRKR